MDTQVPLSPGRQWEVDFFGVRCPYGSFTPPAYQNFDPSVQEIIDAGGRNTGPGGAYNYNPATPRPSVSYDLWKQVQKGLPSYVKGQPHHHLFLYLAIGGMALDIYHGVDAFFFWNGTYVSVDVSITQKKRKGGRRNGSRLKADVLITPADNNPARLRELGRQIAELFQSRLEQPKKRDGFHIRLPIPTDVRFRAGMR
ncbi:MAG: hypothetical protein WCW47_02380 [Candidatus Paceibacterota bacterium]|jgi:hypothetical protein